VSAFLLGTGFRADMGTCARKLVLLKLIDACEDDGSRIFPAISTIARAAQCSTRQVQRELKAFLDIGLIRLVREGGKGPRSTNEYALDLDVLHMLGKSGWALVAGERLAGKGDTVSPLDDGDKGDTGDVERVTPETDKGDKLSHPTPPDPSLDPSVEREAREEDRKKIERDGWALLKDWPGFAGMPKEPALKVWLGLDAVDRAEAMRLFPHWLALLKAQKKTHVPAPSSYFGQKLWREVPEPTEEKPTAIVAPPFGPVWSAVRLRTLLTVPAAEAPPAKGFMAALLAQDDAKGREARLTRQAAHGWPSVNRMHEAAESRRGITVAPELEALATLMEPVPVRGETWQRWLAEHEKRGWPWLPDPGQMPVVYFPVGGPDGLDAFEQKVRGDHDAQQAAE
jgi:hypothetical protein